jgi:tetratricopeptide (TPR) repeat protein
LRIKKTTINYSQSIRAISGRPFQQLIIFFGVIISLTLSRCAAPAFPLLQPVKKYDRKTIALSHAQDYFIRARDYDRRGLQQMAEKYYSLALALDPQSATLRTLMAEKYAQSAKYSQALVTLTGSRQVEELSPDEKRMAARIYIKMGIADRALALFETLPDYSAEERLFMGLLYESTGNQPKAIDNYTTYFDTHPESIETGMKLATLHEARKEFAAADSIYTTLLALHGDNCGVLNGVGNLRFIRGDTSGALLFWKQSLAFDSTNISTLQKCASIYFQRAEYDSASKIYEKLLANKTEALLYGRTLGLLYFYSKQFDRAVSMYHQLLTGNSNDYELHFYLGLAYAAQGNDELAELALQKAIALKSDYFEAWQNLCFLALKLKDGEKALELANRCAAVNPKLSQAWSLVGYVYNSRQEHNLAIEPLARAVQLDTANSTAHFELGSTFERAGRYDEAAVAFRTVLRLKPNDATTANYLGYMWAEHNSNLDSAETLIALALAAEPDNGAYLDSYAWVLYMKGEFPKAYTYICKALVKINNDPIIYRHLGDILVKTGDAPQAISAYRRSIALGSLEQRLIEEKIRGLMDSH